MDNFNTDKKYPAENLNDLTPAHNTGPIPFDDEDTIDQSSVSHSPLNLGVTKPQSEMPTIKAKPAKKITSSDRITGVKTFFTKLHEGSIEFLDEQIGRWLKNNPGIIVKQANTTTGMVVGKKTEPNIIITVWY